VLLDPYNRRYLITDANGDLYTVEDNALLRLAETELTAEVFETYGVQDIPDGALLLTLTDPTILYWHDSQNRFPPFTASYTGSAETADYLLGKHRYVRCIDHRH
jgi:hypothetical protein